MVGTRSPMSLTMSFNELILPWLAGLPLFARCLGFFCISPLFAHRALPSTVRLGLALACALLLTPTLSPTPSASLMLDMITECVVGYLMGVLFSLIFEAAALAGQVIGTLSGFSATELIDPVANTRDPLLQKFFTLLLFACFLALDGHHILLRFFHESLLSIPLHPTSPPSLLELAMASHHLFTYALDLLLMPLTLLGGVIIACALVARFLPQVHIFWVGFPLQLLIGFYALAFTCASFPHQLSLWISDLLHLAQHLF